RCASTSTSSTSCSTSSASWSSARRGCTRAWRPCPRCPGTSAGGCGGRAAGPAPLTDELGRLQRLLGAVLHELADGGSHLDHVAAALRDQVMKLRMVPVSRVFNKHHRTVRELSLQLGKQVRLEIEGAETELDKMLVEQLDDPLVHLVRNAIDHGIEPPLERAAAGKAAEGVLRLRAR